MSNKKVKRPLPPIPGGKPAGPLDDTYLVPVNRRLDSTYDELHSREDYKIQVQNLPDDVTVDDLEMYFESKKQFGKRLEVDKVEFGPGSGSAIITFTSVADATLVLHKHGARPCVYEGHTLCISPVTQSTASSHQIPKRRHTAPHGHDPTHARRPPISERCMSTPETRYPTKHQTTLHEESFEEPTSAYSDGQFSDEYSGSTDTIEVRGFKENCTSDGLKYYFENARRSGGGDMVSFNIYPDRGYLLIKFYSTRVVASVIAKKPHKVEGCILTVRPFYISKTELLLDEIPDNTTDEQLTNFLEAKLKTIVVSVAINHTNSKALVSFDSAYDFQKVVDVCKRFQINHINVIPQQVPVTCSIIVTDLPDDVTESSISLYFENTRRSNGGEVDKTELHPSNQYCIITFIESAVVSRVCLKLDHRIDGQLVSVKSFNEMLGLPDGSDSCMFPEPIILDNFDPDKLKFLKNNPKRRTDFEKQLKDCFVDIIWDDNPVSLECSLEKSDNKHKSLIKSWSQNALDIVKKFTCVLKVKRMKVKDYMWKEVMEGLANVSVPDSDSVSVFVDKVKCEIAVVGDEDKFDTIWEGIEQAVTEVKVKEKKKKESVMRSKDLAKWKLSYLRERDFCGQCESDDLRVEILLEKGKITFTGPKQVVDNALIDMFEQLQSVRPFTINIGVENARLLQNKSVHDRIKDKLQEEELLYVWDLKVDKLIIYGTEDNHFREIESVIWKSLAKITIPLDSGTESVLQSEKWKMTEKSLRQKFRGCIEIKEEKGKLEIYTIDSLQDEVSDELHEFLSNNSVYKEQMSLKPEIVRYIMQVVKSTFEKEKRKLVDRGLKIAELDPAGGAVTLEGTTEGIRAGKKMIQTLQDSMVAKQHTLNHKRIGQYLACSKGKECVTKVEKQVPCYIDMSKSSGNKSSTEKKLHALTKFDRLTCCAEAHHSTGIKLVVFGGDITELTVDVLVNAANKDLAHRGGLARVISDKGGKVIGTECDARIKRKGRLDCGDVFVSSAGKLPCNFVAHAAGPNWNGGHQGEEALLQTTITNCMQKAMKKQQRSIAFPALCTGIYGYPIEKSCTTIVSTVKDFLKNNTTGMKEVIFCDISSRTVCAFTQALQAEFNDVKLLADVTQQTDSQQSPPSRTSRQPEPGKVNMFGKVKVKVVKAIHAKEKVDVIVNSVSTDLDLKKGALSNALLKAAGDVIQRECSSNYPQGIGPGDVAVTSGGRLSCTHIFHIAIKHYDTNHPSRSLQSVNNCVMECLEEADSMRMTSISFPAIGTGAQKYPRHKVAKQMFKTVHTFIKSNPQTSLTLVRFVIYTADDDIFDAFCDEEKSWSTDSGSSRGHSSSGSSGKPIGQLVKEKRGQAEFSIGGCTMLVYEGDITDEDTDAIVASCNMDLDLRKGAVTKALLRKGGNAIQQECDTLKSTMRKEGIVVTTAGNLRSNSIIHVDTKRSPREWRAVIKSALQKSEKHQFTSIAFPALGTSIGCKAGDMAAVMCEVISEFQTTRPTYASEVRLVIFQKDMVPEFIEGCKLSVKGQFVSRRDAGRHRSHDSVLHRRPQTDNSEGDDTQTVTIYAESQDKVTKAIKMFERTITDEWMSKTIEDPGICGISSNYIDQMKKESSKHHVEMKIDTDLGHIHLVGLSGNVLQVVADIVGQLRVAEKSVYRKNQAQLMSNIVKWMYLKGHKSFPFPDNVNLEIETAYRNKDKNVKVKCGTGKYEIDFNNMEEKDLSNPANTLPVIRRDMLNDVSAELPKSWSPMKGSEDLKLVSLRSDQKEYTDVVQDLQSTLGRTPTIAKIERIQNRTLYTQYAAKRKLLDQTHKGNKNERKLWHGTAEYAVQSINAQGFNRSYCGKNAVAIGNGVYFAVNANYSDQGTYTPVGQDGKKRMYRCRVLTGKYCAGSSGMRVPPPINPSNPHILYDSVTNNCSSPIMFVIFNDTQAYPEYIITYT